MPNYFYLFVRSKRLALTRWRHLKGVHCEMQNRTRVFIDVCVCVRVGENFQPKKKKENANKDLRNTDGRTSWAPAAAKIFFNSIDYAITDETLPFSKIYDLPLPFKRVTIIAEYGTKFPHLNNLLNIQTANVCKMLKKKNNQQCLLFFFFANFQPNPLIS